MAGLRFVGTALLILFLLVAAIALLPFFLVGVVAAGIQVAFAAGRHTVTDGIIGRQKKATPNVG